MTALRAHQAGLNVAVVPSVALIWNSNVTVYCPSGRPRAPMSTGDALRSKPSTASNERSSESQPQRALRALGLIGTAVLAPYVTPLTRLSQHVKPPNKAVSELVICDSTLRHLHQSAVTNGSEDVDRAGNMVLGKTFPWCVTFPGGELRSQFVRRIICGRVEFL